VINFVKDNWQALLLFITNPIAGALKLLYDLNPKFREWVDNVWQSIKNGFNKIIDGAKTWGKDLLDNFIGGIKAKIQKLKDMVSNVAQTVKDFLGFSEPEKGPLSNFHTYAPDMIDLFVKGIKDNERKLINQITKTFDFRDDIVNEYGLDDDYGVETYTTVDENYGTIGKSGAGVSVVQNIYSEAKTAADLMLEAEWRAKQAVIFGV
jgi:hypothetical protein